jgi:hypothetical protein
LKKKKKKIKKYHYTFYIPDVLKFVSQQYHQVQSGVN